MINLKIFQIPIFKMKSVALLFISFSLSYILLSFSLEFLKKYFADIPNFRSTHTIIKPKSGGYIFVIGALFSSVLKSNYSFLFSFPLAFVGLMDDRYELSPRLRLFSHFLTVLVLFFYLPDSISLIIKTNYMLIFPVIIVAGVSVINFSNFMDGIDGLVAGCYLIIFSFASYLIDKMYIPIVGVILAFLVLNWYPSKIFMGDIGSTFLGSLFVTALFQSRSLEISIAFILFSFPLLFDAFFCVIRRFLKGKVIFKPHRDHLYQRLVDNNFSPSTISLLYMISTFLIAFNFVRFGLAASIISTIVVLLFGIFLDIKYAKNFT